MVKYFIREILLTPTNTDVLSNRSSWLSSWSMIFFEIFCTKGFLTCDNSASIIMALNETIRWRKFLCTPENGNLRVLPKLATVCWTWGNSPNSIREGVFAAIMWSRHWRPVGLFSDRKLAPLAKFFSSTQKKCVALREYRKSIPKSLGNVSVHKIPHYLFQNSVDTRLELRISWVCRPKTTFVSIDRINENLLNIRSK